MEASKTPWLMGFRGDHRRNKDTDEHCDAADERNRLTSSHAMIWQLSYVTRYQQR